MTYLSLYTRWFKIWPNSHITTRQPTGTLKFDYKTILNVDTKVYLFIITKIQKGGCFPG